jgi:hypothetical protein
MDPYTAVISVGATNPYGHPAQSTLDLLAAAQATVYRTDLDGDVALLIDETAYTVNADPVCSGAETRTCGTTDVGECSLGSLSCNTGMWDASCQSAVEPVTEDCANGLDDDCDGLTDAADSDCSTGSAPVLLVQVAYDTPGTDSLEEFVDLYNPGTSDVAIDSWTLADGAGSWTLPGGHR